MRARARKAFRFGPYFRHFSASASLTGFFRLSRLRAGWTSQGFKFGRLTVNTTNRTYTFDTPGPGAIYSPLPAWSVRALAATVLTRWLLQQPEESATGVRRQHARRAR